MRVPVAATHSYSFRLYPEEYTKLTTCWVHPSCILILSSCTLHSPGIPQSEEKTTACIAIGVHTPIIHRTDCHLCRDFGPLWKAGGDHPWLHPTLTSLLWCSYLVCNILLFSDSTLIAVACSLARVFRGTNGSHHFFWHLCPHSSRNQLLHCLFGVCTPLCHLTPLREDGIRC